jgi:hypothetical protein
MAIKYRVERIGDDCDRGPNGECGIVIVGEENGQAHGETVYCPTNHEHSKACAVAALDAKAVIQAADPDAGKVEIFAPSVREKIAAWFAGQAPKPAIAVAPLPKKEVTVTEDGKSKKKMVEDRDL